MAFLYQDSYIICDEDGITIKMYYFPLGTAKRLHYGEIRKLDVYPMGPLTGQWRIWGGTHRHWLNWDEKRPSKTQAIVIRTDAFVRPVITPDNVEEVLRILAEKSGVQPTRHDEQTPLHKPAR